MQSSKPRSLEERHDLEERGVVLGTVRDHLGGEGLLVRNADAREQAQSATGRSRAVSRQLAELQSQYAAVAGLRDQYEELQRQLEEERSSRERVSEDTTVVRDQLAAAEMALVNLRRESDLLRDQLGEARYRVEHLDPLETEAGRRWIWLVTALIIMLGVLIAVGASLR